MNWVNIAMMARECVYNMVATSTGLINHMVDVVTAYLEPGEFELNGNGVLIRFTSHKKRHTYFFHCGVVKMGMQLDDRYQKLYIFTIQNGCYTTAYVTYSTTREKCMCGHPGKWTMFGSAQAHTFAISFCYNCIIDPYRFFWYGESARAAIVT